MMKLLSVNVSLPKTVEYRGRQVETGIFKEPVSGRVWVRRLNLDGDAQADLKVHGGVDKAVYAYASENYDYWKRELERNDLSFGQFGENLTLEGMTEDVVRVGDVYRIGGATVEVSQPRSPCFKLALKMGNPRFLKIFLASRRTGFYLRVLEEGEVEAGDDVKLIEQDPTALSVRQVVELSYFDRENVEQLKAAVKMRALSAPWHEDFSERLRDGETR